MKKFPKRKWFWPLLLLLGLKALMMSMFISGIIGGNVAAETGIAAERISVSGRNVTIDGFSPGDDTAAVEAAARENVAWTADVKTIVDGPVAVEAAVPSRSIFAVGSSSVVLSGVLASEAEQQGLVDAAKAEFEPDRVVVDEMTVDAEAATEGSGEVIVEGLADDQSQKAAWVASATTVAAANGFEVIDRVNIAEAEEEPVEENTVDDLNALFELELNALFELEPIEFDTSQATIRPESKITLDEASQLIVANADAGNFRVVGHTDSDGDETLNQSLSEARAQAVVDYLVDTGGVEVNRLESEGRGESELKVSPEESANDRQENRRIEWELVS